MRLEGERVLLRVFLGEDDRFEGRPLWEAILERLRAAGFAGATVIRGLAGFGAKSVFHRASLLRLSSDLPIVVEAVEDEAKVRAILADLDRMMGDGLVTIERAHVVLYRAGDGS